MIKAFVYSWKNKTTGRLYVGWHKGSPDDGYICSSLILNEEYKKDSANFERFIIANGTPKDMVSLEAAILRAVDAKNNPDYYNQHNGDGKFCHNEVHTEETKVKMSKAHETRTVYAKGWKMTDEMKARHKVGISKRGEEWKEKIKEYNCKSYSLKTGGLYKINHEKISCPHCGKLGQHAAMKRWHFDNCGGSNNS